MPRIAVLTLAILMALVPTAHAYDTNVQFEDPGTFDYAGASINTEAGNESVCMYNTNVCIKPRVADADKRPNCALPMLRSRILKTVPEENFIEQEYGSLRSLFATVNELQERGQSYPAAHYEICNQDDEATVGALCLGEEGPGNVLICAFVFEYRSDRRAFRF